MNSLYWKEMLRVMFALHLSYLLFTGHSPGICLLPPCVIPKAVFFPEGCHRANSSPISPHVAASTSCLKTHIHKIKETSNESCHKYILQIKYPRQCRNHIINFSVKEGNCNCVEHRRNKIVKDELKQW